MVRFADPRHQHGNADIELRRLIPRKHIRPTDKVFHNIVLEINLLLGLQWLQKVAKTDLAAIVFDVDNNRVLQPVLVYLLLAGVLLRLQAFDVFKAILEAV